jgi:hypothetical protein
LRRESTTLSQIHGHARNLNRLQRDLQRRLPDNLAGRWRLAAVTPESITLMAATPAWAATLRFQQTLVLRTVKQLTGLKPRRCRVVVDPPRQGAQPAPRHTPSPAVIEQLGEAAACQSDPRLRDAMERLANRLATRRSNGGDP